MLPDIQFQLLQMESCTRGGAYRPTQLLTTNLSLCPVFELCKVLQNIISLYCTIHISQIFDNIYLNDLLRWTHSLLAWLVKIKPRSHCVLGHHRLHYFKISQHCKGSVNILYTQHTGRFYHMQQQHVTHSCL
jgi:hypothetical protein